jgi:hypothetical protein
VVLFMMVWLVLLCQLQRASVHLVHQCVLLLQAVAAAAAGQALHLVLGQGLPQLLSELLQQQQDRRSHALGLAGKQMWPKQQACNARYCGCSMFRVLNPHVTYGHMVLTWRHCYVDRCCRCRFLQMCMRLL